jgi:predicted HTH transcriptional regulator
MSIYTTPMSRIGAGDLQELMVEGAVENVRLEFKSEIPNKDETLKKLSSFANTFGGFAVIGAKANSADGRLQELSGVEEQSGYKQRLNQWAFDACSPPLVIEISNPIPVPSGNGKVCYVIYVPESDSAPHFLNGRKGVWVRTDEFSARFSAQLADERELRHLLDRRNLIRQRRTAITERAASRFKRFTKTTLGAESAKKATFLNLSVVPRFPAR